MLLPCWAHAGRRRRRWANLLTALMLLFAVGAVGTGAWALGESILQTNHVISNFWDLVRQVQATVGPHAASTIR